MKKLINIITFLTCSITLQAQFPNVLGYNNFDWMDHEELFHPEEMYNEISPLLEDLMFLEEFEGLCLTYDDFHLIDYNNDGYLDIIYNGEVMESEDMKVYFFKGLCEDSRKSFVFQFELTGKIVEVSSKRREYLQFAIIDYPGCCGTTFNIESYLYNFNFKTMSESFKLFDKKSYVFETEFPKAFSRNQEVITITNSNVMRFEPILDDRQKNMEDGTVRIGNQLGVYQIDNTGIELYRENICGVWWSFVLMEPNLCLEGTVFEEGNNNFVVGEYYGWVLTKQLKVKLDTVLK